MLKKLITLSLMLVFASSFIVAQGTHVLKANGDLVKLKQGKDLQEALSVSKFTRADGQEAKNVVVKAADNPQATADTLNYGTNWTTNFGFFDGNVMMQYFRAPADLTIKAAGFSTSDGSGSANANVSVRLLKLNYTYDQLVGIPSDIDIGYYESEGDGLGGVDPFGEEATSNWIDATDGAYPIPPWADNVDPNANTFDYDLWSDGGFGWPITAEQQSGGGNYQWVEMNLLGFEPTVLQDEVFAVALIHDGSNPEFVDRIGFYAVEQGIPAWKYYEEGLVQELWDGWAVRSFTWDFAVAVELTGDRAPVIDNVTSLLTTVDTGPQAVEAMVTDDNPSGGPAGVASVEIHYSLDGGATFTPVAMADQGGDMFAAEIPGQDPGSAISYKIVATDVEGLVSESGTFNYGIFEIVNTDLLVIFNGGTEGRARQLAPFYIQDLVENYDLWAAYGPVGEFINQYKAVLEISAEGGPADDNREALTNFAASGDKVLGVIGMEILGYLYGYANLTFEAGDYEYEILGVLNSYNDVNYDGVGNQSDPSPVKAIAGTTYGDALAQFQAENGFETISFDPDGILGALNWMDQFDPREDIGSEVFMHGFAFDESERPVGHSWTHPVNTEIFFMSLDPLTLNSDSGWVGSSSLSPLSQFIADKIVGVELTDNTVPQEYVLSQNYPNPFNPSTSINFSIPKSGITTLKVFNILGQEVATLINKNLTAGSYTVDFDARDLSSGMYIYTIQNGDFEVSKKMMLLK